MGKILDLASKPVQMQVSITPLFQTGGMYASHKIGEGAVIIFSLIKHSADLQNYYLLVKTTGCLLLELSGQFQQALIKIPVMPADEELLKKVLIKFIERCHIEKGRFLHANKENYGLSETYKVDFSDSIYYLGPNFFVTPHLFDNLQNCVYIPDDVWQKLCAESPDAAVGHDAGDGA